MVSLVVTALMVGVAVSQWAETTRTALGLASCWPRPTRKSRVGHAVTARVGAPWLMKRLGSIICLRLQRDSRDGTGHPCILASRRRNQAVTALRRTLGARA